MTQPEPTCLLIADISGYTEYLSTVEIDHAQDVLADLIGTVVTSLRPGFRLAKLEGDAAFCFAPAEGVDGSMLLDTIERCYFGFRRRRRNVRQATSCECNACVRIPKLNLKFVAHHGIALRQKVAGHEELLGSDVILVHRLLKNGVVEDMGIEAYAALTDSLVKVMDIDAEALGLRRATEAYEHIGEVPIWVLDLERRWQDEDSRERVRVEPEDAIFDEQWSTTASPQAVWDYITTPGRRMEWQAQGGITSIDEIVKPGGRRGAGSVNHCMHGADAVIEEILDWRPFDYLTVRSTQPPTRGAFKMMLMYELEPTASGTIVHIRVARPRNRRDREFLEQFGPMMAEQMKQSFAIMIGVINEAAATTAAVGPEPPLPARRAASGFLAGLAPIEYVEP